MRPLCTSICGLAIGLGVLPVAITCAAAEDQGAPSPPNVQVHGALHRIMHEADFSAAVTLGPEQSSATTFGIGAMAGLHGEISIIGGRCWVSNLQDGHVLTRIDDGRAVEAALLVTAEVSIWNGMALGARTPLESLPDAVRNHVLSLGLSPEQPLVFRVRGVLPAVNGHVIDGSRITAEMSHQERHDRAVVVTRYDPQPGILIGFISDAHQGIFTHRGESVHAHAVLTTDGVTVHVDDVALPVGAVVELGLAGSATDSRP